MKRADLLLQPIVRLFLSGLTSASISRETRVRALPSFLRMLQMAVSLSSSGGVVLCTSGFINDDIFAYNCHEQAML